MQNTAIHHHHSLADDLDPNDYTFVGVCYIGYNEDILEAYLDEHLALDAYFGGEWRDQVRWSRTTKSGNERGACVLCGSSWKHGSIWKHDESGEHIAVGHICASNYLQWEDKGAKNRAKKARIAEQTRENERRRTQNRKDFDEYLDHNDDFAAAIEACADHYIVKDIVRGCLEWKGYPSEAQHALVVKIHRDEAARKVEAEIEAQIEWIAVPAELLDGRHKIVATVLGSKLKESMYGSTWKMMLRVDSDAGSFKLWGSVPGDIPVPDKGDVVEFVARVDAAEWSDDESFGTFARPTKASIVSSFEG